VRVLNPNASRSDQRAKGVITGAGAPQWQCRESVMSRQVTAFPLRRSRPGLAADAADLLQSLARMLFDPYRPERHYMRGPGPKWQAKHAPRRLAFDTVALPVSPALVRIRRRR
jgi:hypothetical protein